MGLLIKFNENMKNIFIMLILGMFSVLFGYNIFSIDLSPPTDLSPLRGDILNPHLF